jgi:hypothetical protein
MRTVVPRRAVYLFLCLATLGTACIKAPPATVELSEVVGEQIAQMQTSHEEFARLYYAKLREDVERFLAEKWIPSFLAKAVENPGFRTDLDLSYEVASLAPEDIQPRLSIPDGALSPEAEAWLHQGIEQAIENQRAELGHVLIGFGEEALHQIQLQREEMLKPLQEQEAFILKELREGYADLQRAQAAIKAYLASAVRLQEERDVVLKKLGLLDQQQKVLDTAMTLGDQARRLLDKAEDAEEGIAKYKSLLEKGLGKLRGIKSPNGETEPSPNADVPEEPDTGNP